MASFESVVDEYDAGRPSHPPEVYDALEPLAGSLVLDVGAGTGIATRALAERGARVIALDLGPAMLARAATRTPGLRAVVADGAQLPVRERTADLVTFAQSWHWLDPTRRCDEVARVLKSGGRWAAWWSHPFADDEPWFDAYWSMVEGTCPGAHRDQRTTDWGQTVDVASGVEVGNLFTVPWVREVTVDAWMTDQASHSYIAALPSAARERLLAALRSILDDRFPDGAMTVRYETWMWIATRS
jgi:SAM-dependent methyltransferase